jgi:tRNA G26 N,N-dimethylase Trm1
MKVILNLKENEPVCANNHLYDDRLSLEAKGLLSVLKSDMSLMGASVEEIASKCKEDAGYIKDVIRELGEAGYIQLV